MSEAKHDSIAQCNHQIDKINNLTQSSIYHKKSYHLKVHQLNAQIQQQLTKLLNLSIDIKLVMVKILRIFSVPDEEAVTEKML